MILFHVLEFGSSRRKHRDGQEATRRLILLVPGPFTLFWRANYISALKYPRSTRATGAIEVRRCEEDDASKVAVSPDQSAPLHGVKGIKR